MTREEWILSIIDKSGTFIPDRLEADRHFLELLYQNNGFLNAKVVDIDVQTDMHTGQLTIVYEIQEGEQYFIKDIKAPGNDILTEEQLLSALPIRPGQLYSRENITNSIQALETIWGNRGYIYAHIDPSIIPDDETHTVSVCFNSDIGQKVTLNKITIKGNKKTKDKVIRRNITLVEGAPITNYAMEDSKNRIEALGYFDQKEGVNWKTTRLSEDTLILIYS
jgi:outer membrane protein insertion porin family